MTKFIRLPRSDMVTKHTKINKGDGENMINRSYCKIVNGHPITYCDGSPDNALISDMPKERQDRILNWIKRDFIKSNSPFMDRTSYGLKHIIQHIDNTYMTNNQFKDAMMICGFKVYDIEKLNCHFYISKVSPAIIMDEHRYDNNNRYGSNLYCIRKTYEYDKMKKYEIYKKCILRLGDKTVEKVKKWLSENLIGRATYNKKCDTKRVKELLFDDTGIDLTYEETNNLMFMVDYIPYNASKENWIFAISEYSPAIVRFNYKREF